MRAARAARPYNPRVSWGFFSAIVAVTLVACGGANGDRSQTAPGGGSGSSANGSATCPATSPAPSPLPGITAEHEQLAYWLTQAATYGDLDATILDPADIARHNAALAAPFEGQPLRHTDLLAPIDQAAMLREIDERLAFIREHIGSGDYVRQDGTSPTAEETAAFVAVSALPSPANELRVAVDLVPMRCGPSALGLYKPTLDLAFDRNLCSTARQQELVQIVARWPNGMRLARTRYTLGWIDDEAKLSPPLDDAAQQAFAHGPRVAVTRDASIEIGGATLALPIGTLLPGDATSVRVATMGGVETTRPPEGSTPTTRPLTRRAVLERAFAFLGTPYGWGGRDGGRDCSAFLLEVFDAFGIELPRHSARQAVAGSYTIEVPEQVGERDRLQLIEAAARRGVVLLHFPGHIMMYLGKSREGTPMAIHSFAEYVEPCPGETRPDGTPAETLRTVNRVTVSDLTLGRGSSRRAFVERITKITVFTKTAGPELQGTAMPRAAAPVLVPSGRACQDTITASQWRSPAVPNARQAVRLIATNTEDPGPAALALFDAQGHAVPIVEHAMGGPPFTRWARIERLPAGSYTAVLGDGDRAISCERFRVESTPTRPPPGGEGDPSWEPRLRWEADTEALYSAFVEQLFDYPVDEDLTWNDLQTLLQNQENNLLFDHLSSGEDTSLRLHPDCADLPYFLRVYFAWKMRLPFAFRQCARGRAGQPPTCGPPISNLEPREGTTDLEAFNAFIRRVANGVHSATGRTGPRDDDTDTYPVALRRDAMPPGTVYNDPDGHVMVVVRWVPQRADRYGVLIAADAQPDGTIGRPRFWRGTFLFTPETTNVGAGFKAWRPLLVRGGTLTALTNAELARGGEHAPYSTEQYDGTKDDFYDHVESAINPRPLDPSAVMTSLIDALEEQVTRRLVSVDNGVQYVAQHPATIEMPTGYAVFETVGAWEDYSTPSRDMRLLIAIDAVMQFPASLERTPERFALSASEATTLAASLRQRLTSDLAARHFQYVRSDGSPQQLTLADVVARTEGYEVSYNPNDCVEIRWGAPEGSPERATCRRRAPADQQRRMLEYRDWFNTRRRPPRGS